MINLFIKSNSNLDFINAIKYTTGKQKKLYKSITNNLIKYNKKIPVHIIQYFKRLKSFKVLIIEINKKNNKAVSIIKLKFNSVDKITKEKNKKNRSVKYYLIKEKDKWKISYSKVIEEIYSYN